MGTHMEIQMSSPTIPSALDGRGFSISWYDAIMSDEATSRENSSLSEKLNRRRGGVGETVTIVYSGEVEHRDSTGGGRSAPATFSG